MRLYNKYKLLLMTRHLTCNLFKLTGASYFECCRYSSDSIERRVPKTHDELEELKNTPFTQPAKPKTLNVSVLGSPNAGKSTLINNLLGWRVCSVSTKVHTTKKNTAAVLTQGDTQIIFLDTPGLITLAERRKHKLEMTMYSDPALSLNNADLIICLVDVSNVWTRHRLDPIIIDLLKANKDVCSILVLNKIDVMKSKTLLLEITRLLTEGQVGGKLTHRVIAKPKAPSTLEEILRRNEMLEKNSSNDIEQIKLSKKETANLEQRGWPHFQDVFMISALHDDGIADLKMYMLKSAKSGVWKKKPFLVTDQSPQEIATLAVREKLLDKLPHKIPYILNFRIEQWDVTLDLMKIAMIVECPAKKFVGDVIGPAGKIISSTAREAQQELANTFRCEVVLKLIVMHRPTR